jgi:hypothetical protein
LNYYFLQRFLVFFYTSHAEVFAQLPESLIQSGFSNLRFIAFGNRLTNHQLVSRQPHTSFDRSSHDQTPETVKSQSLITSFDSGLFS